MTEDKIQDLLQNADRTLGPPVPVSVELSAIRGRARKRQLARLTTSLGAGVVLVALGFCALTAVDKSREREKIALLQIQIKQLQVRTNATVKLIEEVLENEQKQRRLNELQAQIINTPDPLEEVQQQVDKAAFILVYHADRLCQELNQTDSAIRTYNRVIEFFPKNRWAEVARQRLLEIKNKKRDKTSSEGDLLWKPQNTSSRC